MSNAEFDRCCTGNFEVVNEVIAKGKSINLAGAICLTGSMPTL